MGLAPLGWVGKQRAEHSVCPFLPPRVPLTFSAPGTASRSLIYLQSVLILGFWLPPFLGLCFFHLILFHTSQLLHLPTNLTAQHQGPGWAGLHLLTLKDILKFSFSRITKGYLMGRQSTGYLWLPTILARSGSSYR